ncbi:PrgI family protein [Lactococcus garvieae]|uniref:PrgI family protein n=1 Tax=Lactococcus garvieae TaxID=1363 RepID=A0A1I4GHS4_9LACT|nr:PrgI family protein [Lactococcus garvieae]SFL29063.1 PrgI family protein [Lactococcus garvieae]
MEIEVYKDVSKRQKTYWLNLTAKQWIFIALVFLLLGFGIVNTLALHWVNDNLYQPLSLILMIIVGLFTMLRIQGMPFERWAKLWLRKNTRIQRRIYKLDQKKGYNRNDFKPDKNEKEAV